VDAGVDFAAIERVGRKAGKQLIREINLFDVYRNDDQLGAGKKSYAVSFLLVSDERTLRDAEVDRVMQGVEQRLEQQLGAEVRR
jgi:phenylalanyl-tRNA synthetase beta chain